MQTTQSGQIQTSPSELLKALSVKNPLTTIQAHGLTLQEMKDLQLIHPDDYEKVLATDGKTKINAHERHLIHVTLEQKRFDAKTGEKKSTSNLQKFSVQDFEKMSQTVAKKGDTNRPENAFAEKEVIVLHDPRKVAGYGKKVAKVEIEQESEGEDAPTKEEADALKAEIALLKAKQAEPDSAKPAQKKYEDFSTEDLYARYLKLVGADYIPTSGDSEETTRAKMIAAIRKTLADQKVAK